MPFVPTTVSRMIAATVCGPSTMSTFARCSSARSHSSCGVEAWNAERYRYGPQNLTAPGVEGSLAQRRGSPVSPIDVPVAPW